ncbi:Lysosomal trafficking regulator LYST and related BEACH and WD40 repeat proteins [Phaffia rhodozyma]|uniref:Lysosomal trafficking regulator LYST and related BEACH and WD40 repeat proteins n=1 Tax=Phaffia rhodozyma TaxID=264483 RepID=A0A0F7SI78_PHARH|nr:Lysosomal trafficking regulator LYST and related BEACH and WD40 repeat proteins [Phaffia rhodozyma]
MSFFNKLVNLAVGTPTPSKERGPFVFDDSGASDVVIEPPSKVLEKAVSELQDLGEGKLEKKLEMLSDIYRSMVEDSRTKDLFRDSGGFLALVSVLSGLHPHPESEDTESSGVLVDPEVGEIQRIEALRMVLLCLCEAMVDSPLNRIHFEDQIGFAALSSAIELSEMLLPPSCDHTFSFLLSFAFYDFSLSDLFPSIRRSLASLKPAQFIDPSVYQPIIDVKIQAVQHIFNNLYFPKPLLLLLEAQELLPVGELHLGYAILKSLERISHSAHQRNNLLLSQLSFVSILLPRVFDSPGDLLGSPDDPHRPTLLKLLRRVLETGVSHAESRAIFQLAIGRNGELEEDVLELIRHGMRSRWPGMINHWGRSWLECRGLMDRGFGKDSRGFTFMAWVYISQVDFRTPLPLLTISNTEEHLIFQLTVDHHGQVALDSPSPGSNPISIDKAKLPFGRWVLVSVTGKRSKLGSSDVAVLVDGKRLNSVKFNYPQNGSPGSRLIARIGDRTTSTSSAKDHHRWNLGPAYLLCDTVPDDLVFLAHHLGPRYFGNYQVVLGQFLTYEASTSLNIFLSSVAQESAGRTSDAGSSRLVKALKDGIAIEESSIVFAFSAENAREFEPDLPVETQGEVEEVIINGSLPKVEVAKTVTRGVGLIFGEAVVVKNRSLDEEVWALGGCAPLLRMIELSKTSDQLFNSISICLGSVVEHWRNSEDMEKSHGYEIMARLLQPKMASLMTIETQRVIFQCFGIDFDKPETSTINNSTGYRFLILNFELWAKASVDVQLVHLAHFRDLVRTSRFRRFNIRQRLFKKMALTRKLLFALRAEDYSETVAKVLIETLYVVADSHFSNEDTVKPLVAYLVSSLSPASDTPVNYGPEVLEALARLIRNPSHLAKLHSNLPLHRVLLLFLSGYPKPLVVESTMYIISHLLTSSVGDGFAKKFDNEGGFVQLSKQLASIWDPKIHRLAFSILSGVSIEDYVEGSNSAVACSYIFPSILTALENHLSLISQAVRMRSISGGSIHSTSQASINPDALYEDSERLLRSIINLLTSSPTFAKLTKSRKSVPEKLVAMSTSFLSTTESWSGEPDAQVIGIRESVFELLQTVNRLPRISSSLQSDIHRVLPPKYLHVEHSLPSTSPGPVSQLQRRISLQRRSTADSFESLSESFSSKADRRLSLSRRQSMETRFQGSKDRNLAWRQIILSVEARRFNRAQAEMKQHDELVDTQEWPALRVRYEEERGIWPRVDLDPEWRLDGSEGPLRQRIRLQRSVRDSSDGSSSFHPKRLSKDRLVADDLDEILSPVAHPPTRPWEDSLVLGQDEREESASITTEQIEEPQEPEPISQRQRLKRSMEAGDTIEEFHNTIRIVGVDALPSLILLGKNNIYLFDGLQRADDGEIIEADISSLDAFSIPGSIARVDSDTDGSHRWRYEDIVESSKRSFLFKDVGLELYFKDSLNFLLVFSIKNQRDTLYSKLSAKSESRETSSKNVSLGSMFMSKVGNKIATVINGKLPELEEATYRWQNRQISNFAYIVILNQIAGRTPNDVTQFPVFPWVLCDYTSNELDLRNPNIYRNFTLPMGAMTPARRDAAIERYENTLAVKEDPFHYGVHFSSSMITAGFLIRQSPYTEMFKVLQGGNFDLADRLFSSIPKAWISASRDNRGDVRELIAPFYYGNGEWLVNSNGHDFGRKQDNQIVDDVELPRWARDDPLLFIIKHRSALESIEVSKQLPAWIDLVFGHLQRSRESLNCYHPLSYAGAVDLDAIKDPNERKAAAAMIHNFGQTPRKLFDAPHIKRMVMTGKVSLPVSARFGICENLAILIQSAAPVYELRQSVAALIPHGSKLKPWPSQRLPVPGRNFVLEWGFSGGGLRIYSDDRKVAHITEWASISTVMFIDEKASFVTGSFDGVVSFWKMNQDKPIPELCHSLAGHGDKILCLAASKAWSVLVSGSRNGIVCLWDLNRSKYIRTIYNDPETPVHSLAINEATGYIAIAYLSTVELYTLNGTFICQTLTSHPTDPILSMDFFDTREWSPTQILATGHSKGKIVLWSMTADDTPIGEKAVWKLVPLRTIHLKKGDKADITSLSFLGESIYAGDSLGRVYLFALPDGGAENVSESVSKCMNGEHTSFGLLEQRKWCGGCGGAFCGNCCQNIPRFDMRYCGECRIALALGMIGEVDHEIDIEQHLEFEPGASRTSLILQEQSLRRTSLVGSLEHLPVNTMRRTSLTLNSGGLFPSTSQGMTPQARSRSRAESPHAPANSPSEESSTGSRPRARLRSPSPALDPLEPLRSRSRGRTRSSFSASSSRVPSPLATPAPSRPHSPSPLSTPGGEYRRPLR